MHFRDQETRREKKRERNPIWSFAVQAFSFYFPHFLRSTLHWREKRENVLFKKEIQGTLLSQKKCFNLFCASCVDQVSLSFQSSGDPISLSLPLSSKKSVLHPSFRVSLKPGRNRGPTKKRDLSH